MLDLIKDLLPLLGRPQGPATLARLTRLLGSRREVLTHGPTTYWSYRESGVSLCFGGPRLTTLFLGPVERGGPPFSGALPNGLAFGARRREVHAALGPPVQSSPGGPQYCEECAPGKHLVAVRPAVERYDFLAYRLIFEFGEPERTDPADHLKVLPPRPRPAGDLPILQVIATAKGPAAPRREAPAARVSERGAGAAAEFFCARCRRLAEKLALEGDALESSYGGSTRVPPGRLAAARSCLSRGDAVALHAINASWAALLCPGCRAHYCPKHWFREEGPPPWGDSYSWDMVEYGTCPEGHRRILREA